MKFEEVVFAPGALRTVFQPIVRNEGGQWTVRAFECLTRGPEGTSYAEAPPLFAQAQSLGLEAQMDRACVTTALGTATLHGIKQQLFLNVHPATIASDRGFPAMLVTTAAQCGISTEQLVVEVTEHGRSLVDESLVNGVQALKMLGIQVALDDVGAGPMQLHAYPLWEPQWVKLDRRLFREALPWNAAWRLIETVVDEARRWNIGVIAEGLEWPSDLQVASDLGIDLWQGHLISRPLAADKVRCAHRHLGAATAVAA